MSKQIYDMNSSIVVLGVLLNNPQKLLNDKYKLTGDDFKPELFHRILFWAIRNLLNKGVTEIDEVSIDTFLENYEEYYEICKQNDYLNVITNLKHLANENTFDYHYDNVKKLSLLRYYVDNGFDISYFWNDNVEYAENIETLNKFKLSSIIDYFENINNSAKRNFLVNADIQEDKVGVSFIEVLDSFKEKPLYGSSLGSAYLNSITRGLIKGQLCVFAAPSSGGKSSYGIKVLSEMCLPEVFDLKSNSWVENKSYKGEAGLYIQFELENKREAMPKFISYISKVKNGKILDGKLTDEEYERAVKASYLFEENNVFIVNVADFNVSTIKSIIQEYVLKHGISWVVFDYITDNSNLSSELAKEHKSAIRSDMVLTNLAKQLKLMARAFNVGILTFVQTNGNENNINIVNSSIMSGSQGVKFTADICAGFLPLRKQEEDVAEIWMVNQVKSGYEDVLKPNRCFHMFKTRFNQYPQDCKIYIHLNLSTGEITDCFVTDKFNNFMNVEKTLL